MVFKRRDRRSTLQIAQDAVYPKGGWRRAASYISHRLRRLPDKPERIARGIAAGAFVSFSPMFGLHFVYAGFIAWVLRGNMLAAVLATFIGNPVTFPFIAATSLRFGEWLLGRDTHVPLSQVFVAFSKAAGELSGNFIRLLTGQPTHWDRLELFFESVFAPYMVGSILPGLIAGLIAYRLAYPLLSAYQKRRNRKRAERMEKRMQALAEAAKAEQSKSDG